MSRSLIVLPDDTAGPILDAADVDAPTVSDDTDLMDAG